MMDVAMTDLVIDRVERAALDFDEDIVRGLKGGNWYVDKLKNGRVTRSLESNSLHRCWN